MTSQELYSKIMTTINYFISEDVEKAPVDPGLVIGALEMAKDTIISRVREK